MLVYFEHGLHVNPILKLNDGLLVTFLWRTTVERFPSVFGSFGNREEQLLIVRTDLSPSRAKADDRAAQPSRPHGKRGGGETEQKATGAWQLLGAVRWPVTYILFQEGSIIMVFICRQNENKVPETNAIRASRGEQTPSWNISEPRQISVKSKTSSYKVK